MIMRLMRLSSLLLVACGTDGLPISGDASHVDAPHVDAPFVDAPLVDAAPDATGSCPGTVPPFQCITVTPTPCTTPTTVCHYGATVCTCVPSGMPGKGYWNCGDEKCPSGGPRIGARCDDVPIGTSCCGPLACTCQAVCTSKIWYCYGEGFRPDMTSASYDMCP